MHTPRHTHPLLPNCAPIPIHPASSLASLTREERETLYEWLQTMPTPQVLRKLAAPRPDGFGVQTHLTTLRRFHVRAHSHLQRQLAQDAAELSEAESPNSAPSIDYINRLASHVAFELLHFHPNQLEAFKLVSKHLLRQRDQELDAKALELRAQRIHLKFSREERETQEDAQRWEAQRAPMKLPSKREAAAPKATSQISTLAPQASTSIPQRTDTPQTQLNKTLATCATEPLSHQLPASDIPDTVATLLPLTDTPRTHPKIKPAIPSTSTTPEPNVTEQPAKSLSAPPLSAPHPKPYTHRHTVSHRHHPVPRPASIKAMRQPLGRCHVLKRSVNRVSRARGSTLHLFSEEKLGRSLAPPLGR